MADPDSPPLPEKFRPFRPDGEGVDLQSLADPHSPSLPESADIALSVPGKQSSKDSGVQKKYPLQGPSQGPHDLPLQEHLRAGTAQPKLEEDSVEQLNPRHDSVPVRSPFGRHQ